MSSENKQIIEIADDPESNSEENCQVTKQKSAVEVVLEATCSICLEEMKKDTRTSIACSHQFWYHWTAAGVLSK
jgi:hypothetical protein